MKNILLHLLILLVLTGSATAKLNVVTSTSDLAYFTEVIGGDLVKVKSISSPKSDIHFIEVRPSYMAKIAQADIVMKVGMELDKWMDQLIDGSRNNNLTIVDCSKYIEPLEVPTFKADAKHGDIHPDGNPHYWINPHNVEPILKAITDGLISADSQNEDIYRARMENFLSQVTDLLKSLETKVEKLNDIMVVYYHNSWPYFNEYTGLTSAGFIEPYPGVPPSPSHIKKITELIRNRNIKIIAMEPYFDKRVPEKIARNTGAKVITLYPSIGGRNKGESFREWLEGNLDALIGELQ